MDIKKMIELLDRRELLWGNNQEMTNDQFSMINEGIFVVAKMIIKNDRKKKEPGGL